MYAYEWEYNGTSMTYVGVTMLSMPCAMTDNAVMMVFSGGCCSVEVYTKFIPWFYLLLSTRSERMNEVRWIIITAFLLVHSSSSIHYCFVLLLIDGMLFTIKAHFY